MIEDQKEGQTVDVEVGQLRVEVVELELLVVMEIDGAVVDEVVPEEVDVDAEVDEEDDVLAIEDDVGELDAEVIEEVPSLVLGDETAKIEVVDDDGVAEDVDDVLDTGVVEDKGVVLGEDPEDTATEVELDVLAVDVGLLPQDDTGASDPE